MKKIIIKKFFLFTFVNFTSKKIIEIKNLNEIENLLTKELKIDNNDKSNIILIDSRIIFNYEKENYKDSKKNSNINNNENFSKKKYEKKKGKLTLKKQEDKVIIESLLSKYNNIYIIKNGFQEDIKLINNSYEVFYLPVRQKQQDKDPVIVGKIIFNSFLKPEIIIYLINLYKKIQIKKIIYITNNKNLILEPINKEEYIIIQQKLDKKF
jgi:hypothetical protein